MNAFLWTEDAEGQDVRISFPLREPFAPTVSGGQVSFCCPHPKNVQG